MPQIYIDTKEQFTQEEKDTIKTAFLAEDKTIQVIEQALPVGDLLIRKDTNYKLFERKRLVDFYSSITDGRMFGSENNIGQAMKLSRYNSSIIIIKNKEEEFALYKYTKVGIKVAESVMSGAIISLETDYDIPVKQKKSFDEYVEYIVKSFKHLRIKTPEFKKHGGLRRTDHISILGLTPAEVRNFIIANQNMSLSELYSLPKDKFIQTFGAKGEQVHAFLNGKLTNINDFDGYV